MSVVVKRNACVGEWEDVKGNEHYQANLFSKCWSIPGTFSIDASIRELASFKKYAYLLEVETF